jgi:hypothetical protein
MATRGGGGGGRNRGGVHQFIRQKLFGLGMNMGCVDLDSDKDLESIENSSEAEKKLPEASSPLSTSTLGNNEDPLSHYVPDGG